MSCEFAESIETFVGDGFWPAPRSSGRSVGGEDHVHRAVESGDGEFGSNRFALRRFPVVDTAKTFKMIEESESEDAPLA